MKNKQTTNILGQKYSVEVTNSQKCPALIGLNGYCDSTTHEIKVVDLVEQAKSVSNTKDDLLVEQKRVLRHEIIHAFLFESGIAENSPWDGAYNEEMVDWIAWQIPKIVVACQKVGAL